MIYKTKDGKEFKWEYEALEHEKELKLTEIREQIVPKIVSNWTFYNRVLVTLLVKPKKKNQKALENALVKYCYTCYKNEIYIKDQVRIFTKEDLIDDLKNPHTNKDYKKYLTKEDKIEIYKIITDYVDEITKDSTNLKKLLNRIDFQTQYGLVTKSEFQNLIGLYYQINKVFFTDKVKANLLEDQDFVVNNIKTLAFYDVIDLEYAKKVPGVKLIDLLCDKFYVEKSNYLGINSWRREYDIINLVDRIYIDADFEYKRELGDSEVLPNTYLDESVGSQYWSLLDSIKLPVGTNLVLHHDFLNKVFNQDLFYHSDPYRFEIKVLEVFDNQFKVQFRNDGDLNYNFKKKYKTKHKFIIPNTDWQIDRYTLGKAAREKFKSEAWDKIRTTLYKPT